MKNLKLNSLLQIAVGVPLRRYFHYLPPEVKGWENLQPGMRVRVPFGQRELIGIFTGFTSQSDIEASKLKSIISVIDDKPLISKDILELCFWASDYYHYPIGEVLAHSFPLLLRQGKPLAIYQDHCWCLTETGYNVDFVTLKRAPRQIELLSYFKKHPQGLSAKQLRLQGISNAIIKLASRKEWIARRASKSELMQEKMNQPLTLNIAQQTAVSAIQAASNIFQVFLLNGVTGSGKTEVYLQAIANVLQDQKQVLVLVPEIGLTPQTIQRFRERFAVSVMALHSHLSERERLNAWGRAHSGEVRILIGTRSAVFSPLPHLGLIIVDEEHDLSFKQQDNFRYHARDLAIMRAYFKKIPIVLGSATPALETLHKAQQGKFIHLQLPERAGAAQLPQFSVLDIRNKRLEEGLSQPILEEIQQHLQRGEQVMLFLNRRGFSPILLCHACGWMAVCKRCDKRMTYHKQKQRLHCHHCDSQAALFVQCENCGEKELHPIGLGTERLEYALRKNFPHYSIARLDRDSTQRKGSIETLLQEIQSGKHQILIGTQMLAKGHHFPNVTLVTIIDADSGFFSSDFRALERMGQLLLQVAGRAGRVEKKGKVIIQTHHPDHPLLHQLFHESYQQFATTLLRERVATALPPYSFFALFRAEAHEVRHAMHFLEEVKKLFCPDSKALQWLGPIPAPMPKRAGRHRVQLVIQATQRPTLQNFLKKLLPDIEKMGSKQRVRWSLDVDPMEMF
ncbi:MAG: primosomal protein [Gammaproteobacteria bacterium]|jgi:primosomal protein N' (replication factor Y)|nr:primosomal protein [Gammaproteobacteria bacterium]